MKYEYIIKIKIKDVEEDFYFDSDVNLKRQDIIDNIVVMKRKHKQRQDNSSFDFLKNMFGFK